MFLTRCSLTLFICSSSAGGLFGQQALQPGQPQPTQLYQQVTALSAPTLLGDERDSILAKWNQLQAYWGTGKGYFANNNPPVDFTQENPFCRFKVRPGASTQLSASCGLFHCQYDPNGNPLAFPSLV